MKYYKMVHAWKLLISTEKKGLEKGKRLKDQAFVK